MWLTTAFLELRKPLQVTLKYRVRLHTVLQASQVQLQLFRRLLWQRIDDPILLFLGSHHSPAPQVGEVLRNFHLWLTENVLEVTNTERRLRQQVENSQACPVTKALIDLDQVHRA